MTAVAAAIVAAFLAGAIALYRERRLEARRLKVAARLLSAAITLAAAATSVTAREDSWNVLDEIPGKDTFQETWGEHSAILAGHLSRADWQSVEKATRNYLMRFSIVREGAPNEPPAQERLEGLAEQLKSALRVLQPFCE